MKAVRLPSAALFLLAVLVLEPFAANGLARLSRRQPPLPCTCLGPADATIQIVYLHGLDTHAPSWMELQNRAKLRVLADALPARIALPRAPGRWPQGTRVADSVDIIERAASTCFEGGEFTLLGFSDGANLTNQLFLECRAAVTSTFVSVGSSEGALPRGGTPSPGCGRITFLAGRHEPGFGTTRSFAGQLAKRGADAHFVEHGGPHQLPLPQLVSLFGGAQVRSVRLAAAPAGTAVLLVGATLAIWSGVRRGGFGISRPGAAVLAVACAGALAIGGAPGLLPSLAFASLAVVSIAIGAAAGSGPLASLGTRAAIVLFFAAAGAAWQLGLAPLLAMVLVRS